MFSQLKDKNWKTDVAFLVEIMEYLDNLNVILQGKYSLICESYTAIKAS
jgi:hypothetical protein